MAKFLAQDCYIEIDGHDMSNWCFAVATPSERERVDMSGFNPLGAKEFAAGDREDSIDLGILQDFAAGGPHDILSDIYQNQSTVAVKVRPTSAAASATNPEYGGNGQLLAYTGLDAEKGQRSEIRVEIIPADADGFVWAST
jgi:hypothetical protein